MQQGKFKLNINNKTVSASKKNIALEETVLSHLEILKERLDKKKNLSGPIWGREMDWMASQELSQPAFFQVQIHFPKWQGKRAALFRGRVSP